MGKLGFTGVYFFLIFALKHRLWVLNEAVLMCTHDLYFFVLSIFVILVVSYFGFESGISVLIAPLPGRCLHFTLENVSSAKYLVVLG